ncbi:MAG: DUF4974 domain-containing protein, partial [Chryseobacterium sp.]
SLARLKAKVKDRGQKPRLLVKLFSINNLLKAVATLVLISGVAWLYINNHPAKNLTARTSRTIKIDTLSDGSIVTLNRNSELEYPSKFGDQQRQVVLAKGEAFFKVTPNKEKPFLIKTGNTFIRVIGTSFNVKMKNGSVEVIVESGKVQVSKGDKRIFLLPGEKILISEHAAELKKELIPDLLYNYYRSNEFVANNTPLWRMVEVLNEAYDSHIVIKNPAIKYLPLNTTFKNESLEEILQVIGHTFNISVEQKQKEIILK